MRGQCLKPRLTSHENGQLSGCVGDHCSVWVHCEKVFHVGLEPCPPSSSLWVINVPRGWDRATKCPSPSPLGGAAAVMMSTALHAPFSGESLGWGFLWSPWPRGPLGPALDLAMWSQISGGICMCFLVWNASWIQRRWVSFGAVIRW